MKKHLTPRSCAIAIALLAVACTVHARVKYVPPTGFDGHQWGELRTSAGFAALPEKPVGVGAAWMNPVAKEFIYECMPSGGAIDVDCDFLETLNTLRARFQGGGFYVLSEYSIDDQGARLGSEKAGVLLYPVVYQFCANWDSTKREVPPTFDERNQFCGMRLMFKNETRDELRNLPADHETNYDRVLDKLIEKYGKPDRFTRRARVIVETQEGESTDRKERKFSIWRWCPARDRSLHTSCRASVVLSLDLATGVGTVLYSTPLLWEYAFARQNNGFKGDPLFRVLHARKR